MSPLALRADTTNGTFDVPFSTTLRVIGGTAPYSGTIVAGQLPAGLSFDGATGIISGTPNEPSGTHVVFRFTDHLGQTVTAGWGMGISGGPSSLWFNTGGDLGSVLPGTSYSRQLSACCAASFEWSVVGGTLPPDLSLSPAGLLNGTATTDGIYSFLAQVTDGTNTIARQFTLSVTPMSVSAAVGTSTGNVGTPISVALMATGNIGAVTWTPSPFTYLPPGLELVSSNGSWTLSGTPTASGQYRSP